MTSESSNTTAADSPLGFAQHDHRDCVSRGLAAAEALCAAEGLRFTAGRRKVLEILLQDHRALGAYTVLDRLREDGFGSQPPVAYRALDFLVANGLAHKIERLNAFIACVHPSHSHTPAFMICRMCDAVLRHNPHRRGGRWAMRRVRLAFGSNVLSLRQKVSAQPV